MLGTDPIASRQWLPSTTRPSSRRTSTPSPERSTEAMRDFESTVMPRRPKTCSRTSAASASSPGSTRSRLLTSVTSIPSAL